MRIAPCASSASRDDLYAPGDREEPQVENLHLLACGDPEALAVQGDVLHGFDLGQLLCAEHAFHAPVLDSVGVVFEPAIRAIGQRTAAGTDDEMFELIVADSDGFNPQTVVRHSEPILSPNWAPDGRRLAYVSFATGRSNVVIQDIFTGQRDIVASGAGINGAPAFSPDGRRLAMSLSRSGNPEIWVRELDSGRMSRLTEHWAIDTEPAWTRDGRRILFTSDRAGRPQIYQVDRDGRNVRRVTFEGDYNSRVAVDPYTGKLAMVHGGDANFRIAVLDRETDRLRVLSPGRMDESPSFAPNGRMVLYAASEGTRGVLSAVSVDGRFRQRLVLSDGDVREPAWSPLMQ